jgi:hypothetical protein
MAWLPWETKGLLLEFPLSRRLLKNAARFSQL